MKRIVMMTPGLTEAGGAARRSRLIASELARRGWQVKVVARAGTLRRFSRWKEPNLTVLEVPGFGMRRLGAALFLLVALPLGLVWAARARGLIAIQLTSQTTAAAICGLVWRRPYLSMSTTGGDVSEVAYVTSSRSRPLRKAMLRQAVYVIAQTETAATELRALVPADRTAVVPNPVASAPAAALNGKPHATFTGRLSTEKDLPTLLEAWRPIAEARGDARLTLVGAGGHYRSAEEEVRALVEADPVLTRSVTLTGWVDDVGRYLADADVFVLPSLSEGMSNALLEACSYGRVVVASDIHANTAVLGTDHPFLFPAGNAEALNEALESALTDEAERRRAVDRVAAVTQRHSPEGVATRLEEMIDGARGARHQHA